MAFGDSSRSPADRWFALLMAAYPGLGGFRRVPDRLPVDAMVYLSPPPTFLLDFSHDEVAVLSRVANGTTIASLRDGLQASWRLVAAGGLLAHGARGVDALEVLGDHPRPGRR